MTTRILTTHSDTPDVNQCVHVPWKNYKFRLYDIWQFFSGVAILRGCLYGACAHNFGRWEPFGDYRHANSMPLAWFSSDKPCSQTKYGEQCVCMHACLSFVCLSALFVYLKNGTLKLGLLLCTLPVAVDRSDSDDNAIRYVLPVLLMTSYVFTHWDLRTAKSCARISVRLMVNYSHELSCRLIRHAVTLSSYAVAANSASGGGDEVCYPRFLCWLWWVDCSKDPSKRY